MATVKEIILAGDFYPGKIWTYQYLDSPDFSEFRGLIWLDPSPAPTESEFDAFVSGYTPGPAAVHASTSQLLNALIAKGVITQAEVDAQTP